MKIVNIALSSIVVLSFSLNAAATRIAITDSGTDFSHEWLKSKALINEKEIPGNLVDDDHNGKVDDVVGWNFVDDYGQVFFPEHLKNIDVGVFKYFEIIARIQAGTQTPDDEVFWKEHVTNLSADDKKALVDSLNFYGQYAHSTHCSGIIASIATNSKIMSNRVFPDTPPEQNKFTEGVSDIFYKILSAVTNGSFIKVGAYLKERQIDVANYSLGVSLQAMAKMALIVKGIKNPTPEQLSAETKKAFAQFEPQGRAWMTGSPGTLFVVAAGNDGSDNDSLPTFPANVRVANSISVAASQGFSKLASFSNFGQTTVDIAAPGVAVLSSVPSLDHKQLLPMSGTSMAAPYIVGVASRAKEINPALTPVELKLILMSTVDHKEWLKSKVISEGVVNLERVAMAAEKSKTLSLTEAIKYSLQAVKDQPETTGFTEGVELRGNVSPDMKAFANALVF